MFIHSAYLDFICSFFLILNIFSFPTLDVIDLYMIFPPFFLLQMFIIDFIIMIQKQFFVLNVFCAIFVEILCVLVVD